jgi:uncharacterized membrane protein
MTTTPAPPPEPRLPTAPYVPPALRGLVGGVLRGGVLLSGGLLLVAIIWEAAVGHGSLLQSAAPGSGAGLSALLQHGGPEALVLLGLLVLLVTPLTRVAISVVTFTVVRDRSFLVITLFVLAILSATIALGVLR